MHLEINRYIVVLDDLETARLQHQITALSGIYRRRVLPTLMFSASVMGAAVLISQIVHWIAR